MKGSTSLTIEFLRVRLLAERSVSRTAKRRADELATRVRDLEKQLKTACIERKKAEKATTDVLAILEDAYDPTSDQEETPNDFGKQVEPSENGKVGKNNAQGFSGSEVESSSVDDKSLSSKSSKDYSSSSRMSGNHRLGKGHNLNDHGAEKGLERALKHQKQLIGRYEALEKAQREWEEKFKENEGSIQDSYDPGTHSDVTEERDVGKPPAQPQTDHDPKDSNFGKKPETSSAGQPSAHIEPEPLQTDLQGTTENCSPTDFYSSQCSGRLYHIEDTLCMTLESVLEALEQAKLSLKHNMNRLPFLETGLSSPAYKSGDGFPVPFSSEEIFRLPTDYQYRVAILSSDSRSSLTNQPTDGQLLSSRYNESSSRSATSGDDRFHTIPALPHQEFGPVTTKDYRRV